MERNKIAKLIIDTIRICICGEIIANLICSNTWEDDQGNVGFTITLEKKKYDIIVKSKD